MKNLFTVLITLALTINFSFTVKQLLAQPGAIDTTFNPTDLGYGNGDGANSNISAISIQSDGKIIIGGYFTSYNGIGINRIARIDTDGTLDNSFNPGMGVSGTYNCNVATTSIQSDGKIIIGGSFTSYNDIARSYIARLNPDGSLDNTFNPGISANDIVSTTSIQSDGKIIIGGYFTSYNGTNRSRIARLNTDGTLDTTFNTGTGAYGIVYTTSIQSDGKIIIGGGFTSYNGIGRIRIARLNTDGSLDTSFNPGTGPDYIVYSTSIQNDGKIIIGGWFTSYNGTNKNYIARLNTDGSLDTMFNTGTGASNIIYTTSIQNDGKIIIGGSLASYNGININRIARLNTDGTLDTTFNPGTGANSSIRETSIQNDGKIIIGGGFTSYDGTSRNFIVRLDADGKNDISFNLGSGANFEVWTTSIQVDGKIIIGGDFTAYNGTVRNKIARLNTDGSLDTTFNTGVGANNRITTTFIQSDGKIIIGGWFTSYNGISISRIARLNQDGTLDTTFTSGIGADGGVLTIYVQLDGKIIIGGTFKFYSGIYRSYLARLNQDGTLDNTFNYDNTFNPELSANNSVSTISVQSNGKILIGGYFTSYNKVNRYFIARLNTNGSLDTTFNPGTGANYYVYTSSIQSDEKIIIGGEFTSYNNKRRYSIARLNTNGTLDYSFSDDSINSANVGANYPVMTISIESDEKIIIGGEFTSYNNTKRNYITRLNNDGTIDTTFKSGIGANYYVYTSSIQSDGKIIIGGAFTAYNGTGRRRIARIHGGNSSDVVTESYDISENINVYPNPCEGIFTVALNIKSNTKAGLFVYSINGEKVYSDNITNYKSINLSGLSSGEYIIRVETKTYSGTKKIILK